jgi:tryptophan 2,3-dioxygenase
MKPYEPLYYRDYLQLSSVLNAQSLRSVEYADRAEASAEASAGAHDEMLFIITHQAYELWFKQMLFELDSILALFAQKPLPAPDVATILHRLRRMNSIARVLLQQIDIMETMTPMDFLDFRGVLYPASGFQSLQFRLLEIKLGLSDEQRVQVHLQLDAPDQAAMNAAKAQQSLFVAIERWLERMPFLELGGLGSDGKNELESEIGSGLEGEGAHATPYSFWREYQHAVGAMYAHERDMLAQNISQNAASHPFSLKLLAQIEASEVNFHAFFDAEKYQSLVASGARRLSFRATQAALFVFLYREYPLLQQPFRLLEAVLELDEMFALWRYRHAQMAFRMIGGRVGTGGSSGHEYLASAAMKHRIFTDYFVLSAYLIPRKSLPALPPELSAMLGFSFES